MNQKKEISVQKEISAQNEMQEKMMTCIVCPVGCYMRVSSAPEGGDCTVTGNQCARGETYAIKEFVNPTRILTTTVQISGAAFKRLPVKTTRPVPRDLLQSCMRQLNSLHVQGPVNQGQVLMKNVMNTGVDIVATRSA